LRLLESLRRTISEKLHDRVRRAARGKGRGIPINTSSIYASARNEAPELLDQLLLVHQRVGEEQGSDSPPEAHHPLTDAERRAMLSAVRAAVHQTRERLEA
jgi:hypothetical protein